MATSGQLCRKTAAALGVSFETAREHLRNIRRAGKISFKGYGRGAAAMTAQDAARLLLTVAGSYFVKDSLATLKGFGGLESIGSGKPMRGSLSGEVRPRARLENYLAHEIERLRASIADGSLPEFYTPPSSKDGWRRATLAVTLVSAVREDSEDIPRFAIVRQLSQSGAVSSLPFASPKWPEKVIGVTEYVLRVKNVGLVQERHVTAWALAEIAAII